MEPILLVLSAYGVLLLAVGRSVWIHWRDELRERRLRGYCRELIGQRSEVARELFGEPFGMFPGRGKTLVEWKSPPSDHFPTGSGLLIFYVTVDAGGRIVQASWQTRSEGKWRSGGEPEGPPPAEVSTS
ncbi:MAG: hypothetical protein SGI92_01910 [Bryobacteraceae bacterium]|nr:hypothetical protein [Bryobacteraceae bacterium]